MEFVIITGMSGAGKTGALHVLEDIGYYCVDNLPSSLLSTLYDLCLKSEDDSMKRVAVVVDVRGNEKFEEMCSQIEHFKKRYENVKVLFFDAMTDRLVVRYKETRRRHPLSEKLKPCKMFEFGNVKRIRQTTHINNEICLKRNSVFEPERHKCQRNAL